jgi:hypothetical protein
LAGPQRFGVETARPCRISYPRHSIRSQ